MPIHTVLPQLLGVRELLLADRAPVYLIHAVAPLAKPKEAVGINKFVTVPRQQ
jgi:hypothetical protein